MIGWTYDEMTKKFRIGKNSSEFEKKKKLVSTKMWLEDLKLKK